MTIKKISNDISQSNKELTQSQTSFTTLLQYYQILTENNKIIPMPLNDNEMNKNKKQLESYSAPVSPKHGDLVNDLNKTIRKKSSTLRSSSITTNIPSPPPTDLKSHNSLRRSVLYSPPKDALKAIQPIESKIEGESKETLPPVKAYHYSSFKYNDSKLNESKT